MDTSFDFDDGDSENFEPVALKKAATAKAPAKAKTAATKAAPKGKAPPKKKAAAAGAAPKAAAGKKRRVASDDEDEASEFGGTDLSHTPPAAKKPKKAATTKKTGPSKSTPLKDLNNLNEDEFDEGESMLLATAKELAKKSGKSASETYQMISPTEHVLKRPDTYVGSIERTEHKMWINEKETDNMVLKTISFVPGLYKCFDEIIVNAADNKVRDPSMDTLKVTIDRETNEISVYNNGRGIPIEIHQTVGIYIPEMIFGHLLTSSNYDDDQKKVTGGRNGYGAKLCNIFATEFTVETAEKHSKKKYKQVWKNNMANCGKAKITTVSKGEEYTKITFKPDLQRFQMEEIDDDFEALVRRRVYDIAGSVKGLKVFLNGDRIKIKNFKDYVMMHAKAIHRLANDGDDSEFKPSEVIYEMFDERWEVGFAVSDGSFQQVSFVNAIATIQGGSHVNHISDQICAKLQEGFKKGNKKQLAVLKANQIKNHFFLFVNCLIENPAFTSQTKEQLTTRPSAFGSKCNLTEAFMKKVKNTSIIASMTDLAAAKADQVLKKTDGSRRSRITNAKLVDANKAGTRDGPQCTLILTEGDSAKSLAMSGMEVVGRDLFGVFPLRGKLLNVRDATHDQIANNAEIQNIKQILGLQHKKHYDSAKDLRYGHLMIMTDQDHDGSHIKGLLINFLESHYPSLLQIPGFLIEFITPIVKVYKGDALKPTKQKAFYTIPEYEHWRSNNTEKGWVSKYYKGLGTSTPVEAREYFSDLDKHLKEFHTMHSEDRQLIDMVFSKKKTEERKEWLRLFKPGTFLDHSIDKITYDDFVNKELILFSMADNIRSIPSVVDGLKPGQRKVLFACFKRKLTKEIKVAQLAGYVSEHTNYHHGEQSLASTIVALAQSFVGSNNCNLLEPLGNFGTRLAGGKDASSARYIFTMLSPLARALFPALDDPLLDYNIEDGDQIEPMFYAPCLPTLLINGSDGIGTGWSSFIPNYNPDDLLRNMRHLLDDEELEPMTPWYRNFKGKVERIGPEKYQFTGTVEQVDELKVEITELPVRLWTNEYKEKLDAIIKPPDKADKDKKAAEKKKEKEDKSEKEKPWIKDYLDYNSDLKVHFIIEMENKSNMDAALKEGLENKFKITKTISLTNMVAFDSQGRIMKYESVEDIMKEFYFVRLKLYQDRKDHMLNQMNRQLRKMTNQARFIQMIIKKELNVSNKKRDVLVAELKKLKFDIISNKKAMEEGEAEPLVEPDQDDDTDVGDGYNYLLGMAIWSLTKEKVDKLLAECRGKELEIDELLKKSPKELWRTDLDAFEEEWHRQLAEEKAKYSKRSVVKKSRKVKITGGKAARKLANPDGDSDDDFEVKKPKKFSKVVAKPLKQTTLVSKLPPKLKPTEPKEESDSESVAPRNAPSRRAAAKTSRIVELSDSENSDFDLDPPPRAMKASVTAAITDTKAHEKKKPTAFVMDLDDDTGIQEVGGTSKMSNSSESEDSDMDVDPFLALVKGKDVKPGTSTTFSKKSLATKGDSKPSAPPPKKLAVKSKITLLSDSENEEDELSEAPPSEDDIPAKKSSTKAAVTAPKAGKSGKAAAPSKTAAKQVTSKAKSSKNYILSDDGSEPEVVNLDDSDSDSNMLDDEPVKSTPKKKTLMAGKPSSKTKAPAAAASKARAGRGASKSVKYIDSDDEEEEEVEVDEEEESEASVDEDSDDVWG